MQFRSNQLFRSPWHQLVLLFGGFITIGWLLSLHQVSAATWVLLYSVVLYLSWVGSNGIALALISSMLGTWIATLSTPISSDFLWQGCPLNPAQVWAIALGLSWLLATLLCLRLACIIEVLQNRGFSQLQTCLIALLTAYLGLKLGAFVHLILLPGQSP